MKRFRQAILQVATGIAALSSLCGFGPHAAAQEAIKVRMDFFPYALHAPFHYAVAQGWYKEQGLDVKVDDGNGSVTTVQLVGEGSYDFGLANLSTTAKGISKGVNVLYLLSEKSCTGSMWEFSSTRNWASNRPRKSWTKRSNWWSCKAASWVP